MYETSKGVTMIYPMYPTDLFNYLDDYCVRNCRRGVPFKTATTWLAQILFSVRVQIGRGVVHSDLKLENILLDQNGNAVICDYEGSRLRDPEGKDLLTNEKVSGTPMYLAPELSEHRCISRAKTDLWAVGVIAWELVADSNPWNINIDEMSELQIVNVTNRTTTVQNYENMPGVYFDLVRGLVRPLGERMSVEEAMALPLFDHVDFSDMSTLFPRSSRSDPRAELEQVVDLLKVMSPKAFQGDVPEEGRKGMKKQASFYSEDRGEEDSESVGSTDGDGWGEEMDLAVSAAWAEAVTESDKLEKAFKMDDEGGEVLKRNAEGRGGTVHAQMNAWLKRQSIMYGGEREQETEERESTVNDDRVGDREEGVGIMSVEMRARLFGGFE